jgi:hypothetical protein
MHCIARFALSGNRCFSCKQVVLIILGGCHLLDGLGAYGLHVAHMEIVRCSRGDRIVRAIVLTPSKITKSNSSRSKV